MQTTLLGQKQNSNMQMMGETREPMAADCWTDAQRLAESYAQNLKHDFWILYAAKPHVSKPNTLVAGWEVIAKKPPQAMVGVLVFKWSHQGQQLKVEEDLSLPFDIPISEMEMSNRPEDLIPSILVAAKKSKSILLA